MMFPGLHPMAMMSTNTMGYSSRGPGAFGGVYGSGAPIPYPPIYPPSGPQQGPSQGDAQVSAQLFYSFYGEKSLKRKFHENFYSQN